MARGLGRSTRRPSLVVFSYGAVPYLTMAVRPKTHDKSEAIGWADHREELCKSMAATEAIDMRPGDEKALGVVAPRLAAEVAATDRQERVAALVREYDLYSDDKLGFLWYAEPSRRGIIECVRWQRALARNLTA